MHKLEYENNMKYVDETHGINGYGFQLNIILALVSLRQSCPCASLISNRTNENALALFFSYVKEK